MIETITATPERNKIVKGNGNGKEMDLSGARTRGHNVYCRRLRNFVFGEDWRSELHGEVPWRPGTNEYRVFEPRAGAVMRMIQRKCPCKTWERHQDSECQVEYDLDELFSSYDEWDEEFSDKWQIEYDPEEHFLLPEESDFERDPIELAVEGGNLLLGKDHPLFLRAMTATLDDEEDEILCQLLFDEKKTLDIARSLGMTKLAVVRKIWQATQKIQIFCKGHPSWFAKIPILVPDGATTEVALPLAA